MTALDQVDRIVDEAVVTVRLLCGGAAHHSGPASTAVATGMTMNRAVSALERVHRAGLSHRYSTASGYRYTLTDSFVAAWRAHGRT